MADKTIPQLDDGGAAQNGDLVPVFRSGGTPSEDMHVVLGTMASQDVADFSTEEETEELVNQHPTIVSVSTNLTLNDANHNGAEIWLLPNTSSPSAYTITVPYNLAVGFRCSFVNRAPAGEVTILAATSSPNDKLNGVNSGSAIFGLQYSGAYLRKRALGELTIVGGGVIVS